MRILFPHSSTGTRADRADKEKGLAVAIETFHFDRDGDAPVSVTSPHVPNEGKFPDQIDSGEVADQGWTDTGMPRKRW